MGGTEWTPECQPVRESADARSTDSCDGQGHQEEPIAVPPKDEPRAEDEQQPEDDDRAVEDWRGRGPDPEIADVHPRDAVIRVDDLRDRHPHRELDGPEEQGEPGPLSIVEMHGLRESAVAP